MRVFLSGYFGFQNAGDEALLSALVYGLRDRLPEIKIAILSGDPAATARLHNADAVHWTDAAEILDGIQASNAVLFTGGLFHDTQGVITDRLFTTENWGLALHAGSAYFARLIGLPSLFVGLGAGPLLSSAASSLVRLACRDSPLIAVRDELSRAALAGAGADLSSVHVAADIVFAYPPDLSEPAGLTERLHQLPPGPRLGVSLRAFHFQEDPDVWERGVAEALDDWARTSRGTVVFVPMQTGEGAEDDRLVAGRIAKMMGPSGNSVLLNEPLSPGQARFALAQCGLVVAMRYHAAVFAALDNTPFVAISYDAKVEALAAQLGMSSLVISLGALSGPTLLTLIRAAESDAASIRGRLDPAVNHLRALARAPFDNLVQSLSIRSAPSEENLLLAQSLRGQAHLARRRDAAMRDLDKRVVELADWSQALQSKCRETEEALHVTRSAHPGHDELEKRNRLQADRIAELVDWSERQAKHIHTLIGEVEEAQRAASSRSLFTLFRVAHARKALHVALGFAQRITPEPARRAVRPVYLPLYRALFPAGLREFPTLPKAPPVPRPFAESEPPIELLVRPLVSVILPVWNQPGMLGAAIRGVLNQAYTKLELIVVDDGSTADLETVLREFQGDTRLLCIRRSHEGLPRTLNAGFRFARGEFWTWTSADNFTHPGMIETLVDFLIRHPEVDMTYGNMDLIDDSGKPLLHSNYRVHAQRPEATNQLDLPATVETLGLINDNFIGACFLYRSSIGRALGPYDDSLLGTEDYDYWLRMQSAGVIRHVDSSRCLYSYRVHDDSLSGRHAEPIARNAEELIVFNQERMAASRGPYSIRIAMDAFPENLASAFADAWKNLGHRVDVHSQAGSGPALSVHTFMFDWWHGQDTRANWLLLPSPALAWSVPPLYSQKWSWQGVATTYTAAHRALARKARDNRYPLWDLPSFQPPLVVYLGPIGPNLDWDFLEEIARARPSTTFLFISSEPDPPQDPRAILSACANVVYLGTKRPEEWIAYLSQASVLLAPFREQSSAIPDTIELYLEAAKPILATPVVASSGFALAPCIFFGAQLEEALGAQADPILIDRYLATIRLPARAAHVMRVAQAHFEAQFRRSSQMTQKTGPRLLLETQTFDRGGLERVVLDMARSLHESQFEVAVAVTGVRGEMAEHCRSLGVPVAAFDPTRRADLLITHYSVAGTRSAWQRGTPVLSFIHNSYIWAGPTLHQELSQADLFVSRYIAVSRSAKDFFTRRFGISPAKVITIPNGIDTTRFAHQPPGFTRPQLGLAAGDTVFLIVGSLIGTKCQLHALSAFSRIVRRRPNAKLVLVGTAYDDAYAAVLRSAISQFGLDNHVILLPETESIGSLYVIADAFLSTSLTEGWSLAMTEAMFFGLPILSTAVGGAPEVIENGDIGILVPPAFADALDLNDSNLWAYCTNPAPANLGAIVSAIEAVCADPPMWRSRAAAGRQRVLERYSLPAVARQYEREIRRLLLEHYGDVQWTALPPLALEKPTSARAYM